VNSFDHNNGRVSACEYRQKQKSYRKFPLLAFILKGPKSENLNNSYLLSEIANFDYDFGFE
jgi:hypothetical protein